MLKIYSTTTCLHINLKYHSKLEKAKFLNILDTLLTLPKFHIQGALGEEECERITLLTGKYNLIDLNVFI